MILTLFITNLFIQIISSQTIKTVSPCIGELSNGSRIDLSSIGVSNNFKWKVKASAIIGDSHWYYYNPCKSFRLTDECPENAVCQGTQNEKTFADLGRQDSATFEPNSDFYSILYSSKDGKRISVVDCLCVPNAKDPIFKVMRSSLLDDKTYYNMQLNSTCCCPNGCLPEKPSKTGLSGGSILLILFVCFVSVYLIGGIIYNYTLRKDQANKNLIPNAEFWIVLPSYIRDGVMFTIGGFRKVGYTNNI